MLCMRWLAEVCAPAFLRRDNETLPYVEQISKLDFNEKNNVHVLREINMELEQKRRLNTKPSPVIEYYLDRAMGRSGITSASGCTLGYGDSNGSLFDIIENSILIALLNANNNRPSKLQKIQYHGFLFENAFSEIVERLQKSAQNLVREMCALKTQQG